MILYLGWIGKRDLRWHCNDCHIVHHHVCLHYLLVGTKQQLFCFQVFIWNTSIFRYTNGVLYCPPALLVAKLRYSIITYVRLWGVYGNAIFSAPNWDRVLIFYGHIPLIYEHLFYKYFVCQSSYKRHKWKNIKTSVAWFLFKIEVGFFCEDSSDKWPSKYLQEYFGRYSVGQATKDINV